jgi:hypothetical protein
MRRFLRPAAIVLAATLSTPVAPQAQQMADPDFDTRVAKPAYSGKHPRVLFDEAHNNFHKATGRYKPFADLVTSDGYEVTPGREAFTREALAGYDVLVISNARPQNRPEGLAVESAFAPEECDAVRDWVRGGGALLLIADHWPLSVAARELAARFDVKTSSLGFASDTAHAESGFGDPSRLVFSKENGLLADHPITRGRDKSERVERVVTFTGQSLQGPKGSMPLLQLGPQAVDVATEDIMGPALAELRPEERQASVAGRVQGLALVVGRGRVVVLGEAAMLTAQRHGEERFGMNLPGNDNRQLALNIMHWLSGLSGLSN